MSPSIDDVGQEAQNQPLVAVVGVGYVGSHLVEAFAKVYEVIAFDVSESRVEQITQKFKGQNVRCTSHTGDLAVADALLVAVPTVLNDDKTIDTTFLEAAVQTISQHAKHGATVVMESSVSVGMTREFLSPLLASKGLKIGMSPERVDTGRKFPAFKDIPKIISGIDTSSLDAIQRLYGRVFTTLVPVSSPEVAEMSKLYENCQRMVCAAYANEMADACAALGIDGWEVNKAAASKPFGYMPFWPGPGVGGHCIPVNPYYLLRTCEMPILRQATETSWRRPQQIADRLVQVLERKRTGLSNGKPLEIAQGPSGDQSFPSDRSSSDEEQSPKRQRLSNGESLSNGHSSSNGHHLSNGQLTPPTNTRVLVVGVSYKKGQTMLHNAPGVGAIQSLQNDHHVHVEYADPLVDQEALPHVSRLDTSVDWNKEYLETFDGILVTMDQAGLDMDLLSLLDGVVVHDYSPRLHL